MSVQDAMRKLDELAQELDGLSRGLLKVEQELEPVDDLYQAFIEDFEVGLYQRSVDEDGYKLPSEAMRLKLAHRAMAPDLYGRHRALVLQRERGRERIRNVKAQVDAQRSILSALKIELEATR